jgi:hypothetical protein
MLDERTHRLYRKLTWVFFLLGFTTLPVIYALPDGIWVTLLSLAGATAALVGMAFGIAARAQIRIWGRKDE